MRVFLIVVACALVCGCDQIPGTSANLEKRGQEAAANVLIDPSSAQFRNTSVKDGYVCGEINGKNRMGAYVGFTRFFWSSTTNNALIDPEFDQSDLISAEELCTSMRGNPYSSYGSTQQACDRAQEQRLNKILRETFESSYKIFCSKS